MQGDNGSLNETFRTGRNDPAMKTPVVLPGAATVQSWRAGRVALGAALVLFALAACTSAPGLEVEPSDPLTGKWSGEWGPNADRRNPVELELHWNGTELQGIVNPGPRALELTKASFDEKAGVIKMELDATDGEGRPVHYGIEGKVEGNTMIGSWNRDNQQGDFSLTKHR